MSSSLTTSASKPKKPYGAWRSPISSAFIAESSIGLTALRPHVNASGDGSVDVYWVEGRASEKGRKVPVRYSNGKSTDVIPGAPFAARTGVHEYGGGEYTIVDSKEPGTIVFANASDQRLYLTRPGAAVGTLPVALTPESKNGALRYADGVVDAARHRLYVVHEDHSKIPPHGAAPAAGTAATSSDAAIPQPTNSIVWVSLSTPGADSKAVPKIHTVASGHDFYSAPRLNPAGTQLAFIAYHPNMPWDSTMLYTVDIGADGSFSKPTLVAGGGRQPESIIEPSYGPDGALYFVSDRTNWWNLYRVIGGAAAAAGGDNKSNVECVVKHSSEFSVPQWVFGNKSYDFVNSNTLVAVHGSDNGSVLALVHADTHKMTDIELPFTSIDSVSYAKGKVYFLGAAPTIPSAVVVYDLSEQKYTILRSSVSIDVKQLDGYLSIPRAVEFATERNRTAFGYYYPPANKDFASTTTIAADAAEKPPLLVKIHGGPTGATSTRFRLDIQYWTSRGFGVLDVNYSGSTGFGRQYRDRLQGTWGVDDVNDCCAGALFCVAQGWVDRDRLCITGGSAGGFTSLAALTFRPDVFRTGASHYGVADLTALALDTHKFEARYLDGLIAPYPSGKAVYDARSPLVHINKLTRPVILFQGLDDKVVPPAQCVSMYESVKAKGLPVSCVMFEGEGHGFRQAANIRRALDGEFYFYAQLFGYEPADTMAEPPRIENPGYKYAKELRFGLTIAHAVAAIGTLIYLVSKKK